MANDYRILIEQKQKEYEMLEAQAKFAESEEEIEARQNREREARKARLGELAIERKKIVFEFFKELTGREMTDVEYNRYIEIIEDVKTRKGFNLKNFIDGDDGKEIPKK